MTAADGIGLYLVDAFAERPFGGNPAAVCLLQGSSWPADVWLQSVAAELKHSETAFLRAIADAYELRWFTPTVEVDLCGHATLASAFVLWQQGHVNCDELLSFSTHSGTLTARHRGEQIELDFPLERQTAASAPPGLAESLGVAPTYVGRNRFDYLIEVASEAELRRIAPDFRRLAAVDCRGVIVTARSSHESYDFVSRFFAPASGVDEDPVTGSAHCTLAHYWQERLQKYRFTAYQASPRGGVVNVEIAGDRVLLRGRAVLVFAGHLQVAPPG